MNRCDCCGCVFDSDYGTSLVSGSGTKTDPYVVEVSNDTWVRPSARVRRTTSQSIPSSTTTPTAIVFDTEEYDNAAFWPGSSNSRVVVPEDGIYWFGGCVLWPANAVGVREIGLRLNGTTMLQHNDLVVDPFTAAAGWQQVNYQAILVAGDEIELMVRQESGGALNLIAEEFESMALWIAYMGRTI